MLDHLIVTIYGYELSIHRLIQLIDLFLRGTAVSAGGGLQKGEFIVLGVTIWSSSWGLSSGDVGFGLYGLCPNGELTL